VRLLVSNQLDMCTCVIGPRVGADSGGSREGGGGGHVCAGVLSDKAELRRGCSID